MKTHKAAALIFKIFFVPTLHSLTLYIAVVASLGAPSGENLVSHLIVGKSHFIVKNLHRIFSIDKGLTDESEILKFLQHGTLVGLLPVPHPILIRKYIANAATNHWFRTYMWGVLYLRYLQVLCTSFLLYLLF